MVIPMATQQSNDDFFNQIPKGNIDGIEDNDEILLALLYLLEEFYDKYYTKSPNYILKHIDDDIDKLKKNMFDKLDERKGSYIDDLEYAYLLKHNITQDLQAKVQLEYDVNITLEVTKSTLEAILEQLRQDVKTKALVWNDIGNQVNDFNIKANYTRASKRLTDAGNYYKNTVKQKIARAVQKFVYDKSVLYYWACLGTNPCSWCIAQSKSPPRKLEDWEYDHQNGHCALIPVEIAYSDEYKELIGGIV